MVPPPGRRDQWPSGSTLERAGRADRQLPDQSTTLWVDFSSTDDPRLANSRHVQRESAEAGGLSHPLADRATDQFELIKVRRPRLFLTRVPRSANKGAP